MKKNHLSINSENILPIIKKWLYSEKDIFLRELVSNATDAINKLKLINAANKDSFRIDIQIDKDNKTISISDNGIGMNEEEVKKYIAQIAFSGAEDFLEKYKTHDEKDQIIGHFGLGFYSAYMVANKVEVDTRSYIEKEAPVLWSCDGSSEYFLSKSKRTDTGTTIILHINKENEEYLDKNVLLKILNNFCLFLPYPIYLNDQHINNEYPLYLKSPSECTEKEYLEFYRKLYPLNPDPIFWVHLNVDYPFNLKGILYFPKIGQSFDANKNAIKLFCNRVFVSDNCKDLLPDFLMILQGAIDSPDIPLNISRSFLQMDSTVRKLSSHISKKISDRLSSLYKLDKEKFTSYWPSIETVIKLGILQDEKFYERSKSFLIWKNTDSNWTTIEDYISANEVKKDKVFYTHENTDSSHFLDLYRSKQIEVLYTNHYIDVAILNFLEKKLSVHFQRIDGGIDPSILDTSKEKNVLDSDGRTQSSKLAEFIKNALSIEDLDVEAKSLASEAIPGFIMLKEEERRLRDYLHLTGNESFNMPTKKTFVVNTNSSLVNNAHKLHNKYPEIAKDLIKQIYDLSLLSQKEMEAEEISNFVSRSNSILEKLVSIN
jgi:molecular chaperone HtpG